MKKHVTSLLLISKIILFGYCQLFAQDSHKIDSLNRILFAEIHDTTKIEILIQLASEFSNSDKKKESEYLKQALDKSIQIEKPLEEVIAINKIGIYYINHDKFREAINIYEQTLNACQIVGNSVLVSDVYGNIGRIYKVLGVYDKSLEYYQKSLEIDIALKDNRRIAYGYGSVGNIYKKVANFEKALEYYQKALELNEELDIPSGIAYTCNGLGSIFSDLGNYEKAILYYQKALEINQKIITNQI